MKKAILAAAFLAAFTAHAHASNWVAVVNSTSGVSVYVDTETVKRSRSTTEVWVKNVYDSPRRADWGGFSYDSIIAKQHINCSAQTFYSTSASWRLNGEAQGPTVDRSNDSDIPPDTLEQEVAKWACQS